MDLGIQDQFYFQKRQWLPSSKHDIVRHPESAWQNRHPVLLVRIVPEYKKTEEHAVHIHVDEIK